MVALAIYMVHYQIYDEYAHSVFGLSSDDSRKLFLEIPLSIAYTAFFESPPNFLDTL